MLSITQRPMLGMPTSSALARCAYRRQTSALRSLSSTSRSLQPSYTAARFAQDPSKEDHTVPSSPPRMRFAPSPTGFLHLGGLRTALFNHLFAKRWGGTWVLRIEDTDQRRLVPGSAQALQDMLSWAGLEPDEGPGKPGSSGPYMQSERLELYTKAAEKLIADGHAYRDFRPGSIESGKPAPTAGPAVRAARGDEYAVPDEDEARRLIADGRKYIVRLRLKPEATSHQDLVYGNLDFPYDPTAEDPVLIKSDGWPTYHLANVVDDAAMGITHVLRGEEWIPSVPLHLAIYQALGIPPPAFAHLPLLVNPDGTKLSKRSGAAVRVEDYVERGFEPEALCNFVGLMGCNWHGREAGDHPEVMSMEEMIKDFSLANITHSRAALNPSKLSFLNRQHLQYKLSGSRGGATAKATVAKARSFLVERYPQAIDELDGDRVERVLELVKERAETLAQVPDEAVDLFVQPDWSAKEAQKMRLSSQKSLVPSLRATIDMLSKLSDAEAEDTARLASELHNLAAQVGGGGNLMRPLRYALTGKKAGPAVPEYLAVMGRTRAIERLKAALALEDEGLKV